MGRARRRFGKLIATVVPDVPSFSVDGGFRYEALEGTQVGSIVRVPLAGRTVRGWVTRLEEGDSSGLKRIKSISGELPIFDERLLEVLRWAAYHYVAPLSVMLPRAGPPNLPRIAKERQGAPPHAAGDHLPAPVRELTTGARRRPLYVLAGKEEQQVAADAVLAAAAAGRSVMVVLPTAAEVEGFADRVDDLGGQPLVVLPSTPARAATRAWSQAATRPGTVIVGTHRIVFWPVKQLELIVMIEEGRRAMKDRQTPTVHGRDVARRRAIIEKFGILYVGSVPSTALLATGVEVTTLSGHRRAWPPVEIVDRTEEPPNIGLLADRTRAAIAQALRTGRRVFVFTHRHGYAPASRCASCRTIRLCPGCGTRPEPGDVCTRCGAALGPCVACGSRQFVPLGAGTGRVQEEIRRAFGDVVGGVGSEASIWVGTERDLPRLGEVSLGVAIDADGLIHGSAYNAAEEALRVLARLASLIPFGDGRRLIVQTIEPRHPVLETLTSGDPLPFLRREISARARLGLPPAGEVLVLEVAEGTAGELLESVATKEVSILGPALHHGRERWLVQGADLTRFKQTLRPLVQRLRDGGATVRIDVDPLDL